MEVLLLKLKRLVNKEFYQFFVFLLALIDAFDPAKIKVKSRRDALEAIKNRLAAALDREKASAFTEEIKRLNKERGAAYSGFFLWLKGLAKSPDLAVQKQAKVVLNYLKSHGKGVTRLNLPAQTAVLLDIVSDFKTNPALTAAAAVLKPQVFLNAIEAKNNAFIDVNKQRVVETGSANATEESFISIRPEAIEAFEEYVKLIVGRYYTGIEDKIDITDVVKCIEQTNALIEKFIPLTLPKKDDDDDKNPKDGKDNTPKL